MVDIQVRIEGLEPLISALRQWPSIVEAELKKVLEASGADLLGDLQRYPSPPPGSTYRRTGTLGRTWTSKPVAGPGQRIGNATSYAVFVQGDPPAKMHRGRWLDIRKALQQRLASIESRAQQALERIAA